MPGLVTIASPRAQARVTALCADEPPSITGGYGGWQEVMRPHRQAATTWGGFPSRRLALTIVMNAHGSDGSVEADVAQLEKMARTVVDGAPAQVSVSGDVIPAAASGATWVIDRLDWGQAIRRLDGARTRQLVGIEFIEYLAPDVAVFAATASKAARIYVWKKGDTLQKVAQRLLGKASRWREIAKLNSIRDPRKIKVGQRIRIPVK